MLSRFQTWYAKQSTFNLRLWAIFLAFVTLATILAILAFAPLWVVMILVILGSFSYRLFYGRSGFDDLEDKVQADSLWLRERK